MADNATNSGGQQDKSNLPPPGSYLFIGPRNSGKTVFFVAAMEQLFRLVGEKKIKGCKLKVHYSSDPSQQLSTQSFITETAELLRVGKWPAQSIASERHVVRLTRGGWVYDSHEYLALCDYPGMAFDAAFSPPGTQISDPTGEINSQAQILKREVKQAAGIFLTVDSECLYNGSGPNGISRDFLNQLTCLAQFMDANSDKSSLNWLIGCCYSPLRDSLLMNLSSSLYTWLTTGQRKLAVLFTKSDLLPADFNYRKAMLEISPYVMANLSQLKNVDTRLFRVSAVPGIAREQGARIPKDWTPNQPTGLTNAFAWMLGMEMPAECLMPDTDLGSLQ